MTDPTGRRLRAEFPALANWTYLNTATYGQMPRSAADAMGRHLARRDELACGDYLAWFDDMDAIRESCARLVHCEARGYRVCDQRVDGTGDPDHGASVAARRRGAHAR